MTLTEYAVLDGRLLAVSEAQIPVADRGIQIGLGVFETFRARRGRVFLLDRHLQRLRSGTRLLGIELPVGDAEVSSWLALALEHNVCDDARCRITVTAGAPADRPHLFITISPQTAYPPARYEQGMTAVIVPYRRDAADPLLAVKCTSYARNAHALAAAQTSGADEALWLNTAGYLSEGTKTNLFWWRDGQLCTPSTNCGLLAGVTRGVVLEIAADADQAAATGEYSLSALLQAEEAFLTNAVMGVMPLVGVEGSAIGDGAPGPLTRRLMAIHEAWVETHAVAPMHDSDR